MAHSTTIEEEKPSEVTYTNSADKLALRSAQNDTTPSQPTETVAKKVDSSISAGTAALGATAVGIAGHVASQTLSADEGTKIVKDSAEKVEETAGTVEVNEETVSNAIEDKVENVIEETAEEIVDEDGSSVNDLLSKGVTTAGAAVAGLAIAGKDDADEDLNEVADTNIEESLDAGLESLEESIEESVDIDTLTLEETAGTTEEIIDEIPGATIEDALDTDLKIVEESLNVDTLSFEETLTETIESKAEEVVNDGDESPVEDLLSKDVTATGAAATGIAGLATTGDGDTNEVSMSTEDDSTDNLETDNQEAEENLDIDRSALEKVAEIDDETISDAITDKIEGIIEGKVDNTGDNADESSIGDLLSKGATAAGAAGLASDGESSTDIEPLTSKESSTDLEPSADIAKSDGSSQPNTYLDSILAEGASVIAGLESSKLRIIEGIGKKMEAILHDNDINTWKDLSMKSDTDLRDILDQHGDKYNGVELNGWIEQAALLADGKVEELISLQKQDGSASQLEVWLKDA